MNPLIQFFIDLFELLKLYSRQNGLAEHLKGMDAECNPMGGQSIYAIIFLYIFAINSLLMINYYYGYFNRVPYNRWGVWLINAASGAVVLFILAFTYSHNDLENQRICADLAVSSSDCVGFGLTAGIYSIVYCTMFSYVIKWWSSVNRIVNPFYLF